MSDSERYYTDDYTDDDDDDYPAPHVLCECKACYQRSNCHAEACDVIAAYHERNYEYCIDPSPNQEFLETPEDRAHYERHMREQTRCNRHVILTYRGFRVSFPEPLGASWHYRHSCPEDETSENDEKMRQLVVQGLWSDEIKMGYINLIDDFKYSEAQSYWEKTPHTAFPRHKMLVAAAFTSSIAVLERQLWCGPVKYVRGCMDPVVMSKSKSKAMTLAPASSIFTETTEQQRSKLLAYAGIAGKLIVQLFANCGALHCQTIRNSAFTMTQRVHSLMTCEILMDNRYWCRGRFCKSEFEIEASAHADAANAHAADAADADSVMPPIPIPPPMPLQEMIAEFRELYHNHIADMKCAALKYRKGYVNLHQLRLDPIKTRFYSLMLQCMKMLMCLDKNRDFMKRSNRVMEFIAEFPEIFHEDISRIFGLSKLRMSTRETQLRLANQGSYCAFLSFAASNPRMVDAFLAPEVGTRYGGAYSVLDCENYVSTQHRVFGELLKTHRHHIPRTAEVMGDICRSHVLL